MTYTCLVVLSRRGYIAVRGLVNRARSLLVGAMSIKRNCRCAAEWERALPIVSTVLAKKKKSKTAHYTTDPCGGVYSLLLDLLQAANFSPYNYTVPHPATYCQFCDQWRSFPQSDINRGMFRNLLMFVNLRFLGYKRLPTARIALAQLPRIILSFLSQFYT